MNLNTLINRLSPSRYFGEGENRAVEYTLTLTAAEYAELFHDGFPSDVERELVRVRQMHPPVHSYHEALGLLEEEVEEFREIVFLKEALRDNYEARKELVQIGQLVQRIAEDLL